MDVNIVRATTHMEIKPGDLQTISSSAVSSQNRALLGGPIGPKTLIAASIRKWNQFAVPKLRERRFLVVFHMWRDASLQFKNRGRRCSISLKLPSGVMYEPDADRMKYAAVV
jgi:hypothetical protein